MTSIGGGSQHLIGQMSRSFESIGLGQQEVKTVFDSFQGLGDNLVHFADKMVDHMNMGLEKAGAEVLQDVRGGAAKVKDDVNWKVSDVAVKEQNPTYKELWTGGDSMDGKKLSDFSRFDHTKHAGTNVAKPIPATKFKSYEPLEAAGKKSVFMDGKGISPAAAGGAAAAPGIPLLEQASFSPLASLAGAAISAPGGLAVQEPFPRELSGGNQPSLSKMTELVDSIDLKFNSLFNSIKDVVENSDLTLKVQKGGQLISSMRDQMSAISTSITRNIPRD
jgi:hypothetical protein